MRNLRPSGLAVSVCFAGAAFLSPALAQAPNRISEHVDDSRRFILGDTVHPKTRIATDIGSADPDLTLPVVTVHLAISAEQQQKLEALLKDQQDKKNPRFHQWLTPEQFAKQFGANEHDVSKVKQWLEEHGFRHVTVSRGHTFITASGNAAKAQDAFETPIHMYRLGENVHYANAAPVTLPHAFEGLVMNVTGLNSFRPKPRLARMRPRLTSDQTGNHFVAPSDFATIYDLNPLYSAGIDGTGVKIAVPGQTDVDVTQVNTFRSLAGLSVNTPTVMNLTGHSLSKADQGEAYLDMEWTGAVAKNASIIYVNADNVTNAEQYIADNNLAAVMSIAYGVCEATDNGSTGQITSDNQLFQQATAEGMTVLSASGDYGAADCDEPLAANATTPTTATHGLAVDFPASSAYVTGVGGTAFNEGVASYWAATNGSGGGSALSYIPETAWNDTVANGNIEGASGGGASKYFPKPNWQTGTGVPNDGFRDVPDVAMHASQADGTLICGSENGASVTDCTGTNSNGDGFRGTDGSFDVVSGTSVSAPSFAGIVALLVQQNGPQGNINPRLYELANESTDAFHDITSGNNDVACTANSTNCPASGQMGFVATQGYDQVTGLGSVDANHFVNEWGPDFTMGLSPTSISMANGATGSSTLSAAAVGAFSNSISLTCSVSAALTKTTCSIPATVSPGASVTVSVTDGNTTHVVPWQRKTPGGAWPWVLLALLGGTLAVWPRSRKRVLKGAFATGCFALALACGGGSSGGTTTTTPPPHVSITGSVIITGTGGGKTHSVTLTVTDQ